MLSENNNSQTEVSLPNEPVTELTLDSDAIVARMLDRLHQRRIDDADFKDRLPSPRLSLHLTRMKEQSRSRSSSRIHNREPRD
jgi:hypothetical protein